MTRRKQTRKSGAARFSLILGLTLTLLVFALPPCIAVPGPVLPDCCGHDNGCHHHPETARLCAMQAVALAAPQHVRRIVAVAMSALPRPQAETALPRMEQVATIRYTIDGAGLYLRNSILLT